MKVVYTFESYRNAIYRAVLSILLGIVLIIWPGAAPRFIIMLIGVIFLGTGLISFWNTYRNKKENQHSGIYSVSIIGAVILGLLLICMPSVFVAISMFVLGIVLVFAAIGQFVTLIAARQYGYVASVSYVFPVLILLAGIVIVFNPFKSIEGIMIMFGITSVFYGITDLINQYSINKLRKERDRKEKMKRMEDSDIEDAQYDE